MSPVISDTYFKVVCDHCGESFPEHESGGGFMLYETEKEAREETEYDGRVDADGRTWCPRCIEEGLVPDPQQEQCGGSGEFGFDESDKLALEGGEMEE